MRTWLIYNIEAVLPEMMP